MGIKSPPVLLGPARAARVACIVMAVPQVFVIGLLLFWHRPITALIIMGLLSGQLLLMKRFIETPTEKAIWYSGFGVPLYVLGMLISAFAVQHLGGAL